LAPWIQWRLRALGHRRWSAWCSLAAAQGTGVIEALRQAPSTWTRCAQSIGRVAIVRAVLTGAAGFVGRHLATHLVEERDEVVGIDQGVDVTDPTALTSAFESARPDAIYHLAAQSHVGASWDDPSEVYRVNALGTNNVLTAARRAAPSATVLVVSSAEVYGVVTEDELPIAENAELRAGSPYAASKAAAELIAFQAAIGYGQRVVMVRPFNHVGPGQAPTFFVPAVARRLVEARRNDTKKVTVGNLTARRDFTDVRDVVRAYRLVVLGGTSGGVYNVCSGVDVAISHVAETLRRLLYRDAVFVEDPSLSRPLDIPVLRGDPTKLRATTGWVPHITLDETLRDVAVEAEAAAT
jgi:GDP-4-dehydro-6-deoxy-D-mannose reductase